MTKKTDYVFLNSPLERCEEKAKWKDLCDETLFDIFKKCEDYIRDVCSGDSGV